MSTTENLNQLARYRLQQAKETQEEAEYLYEGSKSPRSVMNRVYYSMYYAVLALLIFEEYVTSKHTGVLSYFNKVFIKEGIFHKEMGKWINKAFELRQSGDYREYIVLTPEQVEPFLGYSKDFIANVSKYLKDSRSI